MNLLETSYRTPIDSNDRVVSVETDSALLTELFQPITSERFFSFLNKILFTTESHTELPYLSFVKLYIQNSSEIKTSLKSLEMNRVNLITGSTSIFPILKEAVLTIVDEMIATDQVPYQKFARAMYEVYLTRIATYLQRVPLASNE